MNKANTNELKELNSLIPSYLKSGALERNNEGAFLCPICKKPLTYIEGTNHIECEYCCNKEGKRLIRGFISLLMFNENLSFKDALKKARKEIKLFNLSVKSAPIKDYSELDKRVIGVEYLNNKLDLLSIYKSDYQRKPLVFTDKIIGSFVFSLLYPFMDSQELPNFLCISNTNYVFNAVSVLMKMTNNHKIKIFLLFENDKESNKIKRHLLHDLYKYDFLNFIEIADIINHDKEHTIIKHYQNNKDSFKYEMANILTTFNARYKKPILSEEIIKGEELSEQKEKTPKNA